MSKHERVGTSSIDKSQRSKQRSELQSAWQRKEGAGLNPGQERGAERSTYREMTTKTAAGAQTQPRHGTSPMRVAVAANRAAMAPRHHGSRATMAAMASTSLTGTGEVWRRRRGWFPGDRSRGGDGLAPTPADEIPHRQRESPPRLAATQRAWPNPVFRSSAAL